MTVTIDHRHVQIIKFNVFAVFNLKSVFVIAPPQLEDRGCLYTWSYFSQFLLFIPSLFLSVCLSCLYVCMYIHALYAIVLITQTCQSIGLFMLHLCFIYGLMTQNVFDFYVRLHFYITKWNFLYVCLSVCTQITREIPHAQR